MCLYPSTHLVCIFPSCSSADREKLARCLFGVCFTFLNPRYRIFINQRGKWDQFLWLCQYPLKTSSSNIALQPKQTAQDSPSAACPLTSTCTSAFYPAPSAFPSWLQLLHHPALTAPSTGSDTFPLSGRQLLPPCAAHLCICQHQSTQCSSLTFDDPQPPALPELQAAEGHPSSACLLQDMYLAHRRCCNWNPLCVLLSEWLSEDMLNLSGHYLRFWIISYIVLQIFARSFCT